MKNYIAFYIIIIVMVLIFAFKYIVVNNIEYEMLNTAQYMNDRINNDEDFSQSLEHISQLLKKSDTFLNMIINNSHYDEIEKCVAEIQVNQKFNNRELLQINSKKLVFLIQNIIEQEKCKIHNIL